MCCLTRVFVRSSRMWKCTVLSATAEYRSTGTLAEPIFSLPFQIARAAILSFFLVGTLALPAENYGNCCLYTDRAQSAIAARAVVARFADVGVTACRTTLAS